MDEPTNDLDIETLELLEELLLEYPGTLLLVSHDRAFLNNVVTSTIVLEGDGIINEYPGGYDDWLSQRQPVAKVEPKIKAKKVTVEPVVRRPAIRTDNAAKGLAEQVVCALGTAGGEDEKDRHQRGRRNPQPSAFRLLPPARFVHVRGGLTLDIEVGVGNGLGEGVAHNRFERRDASQTNGGMEHGCHRFGDIALAHAHASAQVACRGLETRPKISGWHIGGTRPLGLRTTDQAGPRMATILSHVRFNARKFRDLMPLRLRIFTEQQSTAGAATERAELDDPLDLVKWLEWASTSDVSRLSANLAS